MAAVSPTLGTRSTAPPIISPLMAWPAKPIERSPLSPSSPNAYSSSPIPSTYSKPGSSSSSRALSSPKTDLKGKGKATSDMVEHEEDNGIRNYGPPKRPLTPNQLGRIAQSFGIVIPSLPQSSPSSPGSSSRNLATINPTRGSSHLLTVIPPSALLDLDSRDEDRRRRWRRGRLLPLQPTIGSMLLSIAREYGLPSTVGLSLYLVNTQSSSSSVASASTTSSDECSGPLISPSTWSTLFSAYLHASSSVSRSTSPSHTPLRSGGPFPRDTPFPPSPLSLVDKVSSRERLHSFTSTSKPENSSHRQTISSTLIPPTPGSATFSLSSSIVGTIEFDVDPALATWLAEWKRSGKSHRRKGSSLSDLGIPASGGRKQLRLVKKVEDAKHSSTQLDFNQETPITLEANAAHANDDDFVRDPEADEENYKIGYADAAERKLSIHDQYPGIISVSPSYDQFTESGDISHDLDPNLLAAAESNGIRMEDLLASPIELEKAQMERVRMADDPKRGSGVLMAEELDDLERIMRSLSPREIRLTSPRALTPRMAAKIAAARVQAVSLSAPLQTRQLPTSPLAGDHQSALTLPKPPPLPARRPMPPITPESASRPAANQEEKALERPAWPAVPFKSPSSPNVDDMFKPQPATNSAVSAETLKRMQQSPVRAAPSEWRPPRPARPKSPDLSQFGHARTLSHTLSPEMLEQLRSPQSAAGSAGQSPMSPEGEGKPRLRGRASTVSVKGLKRRISGKNLNLKWGTDKEKETEPALPPRKETVGLFKGAIDGPPASSFASLRDSLPPTTEFGQVIAEEKSPALSSIDQPGSAGSKHGLASRFFSFGRRGSAKDGQVTSRSVSAPTKSNLISPPITSTFHKTTITTPLDAITSANDQGRPSESISPEVDGHHETSPNGISHGLPQSPASPASLKSVRRKPVPGIDGVYASEGYGEGGMRPSDSLSSMRSFVLEDPPKRRKNLA